MTCQVYLSMQPQVRTKGWATARPNTERREGLRPQSMHLAAEVRTKGWASGRPTTERRGGLRPQSMHFAAEARMLHTHQAAGVQTAALPCSLRVATNIVSGIYWGDMLKLSLALDMH